MVTINEMKHQTDLPVLISDDQGLIIYVNECFSKIFEWEFADIVGKSIITIIPNSYHDSHNLGFARFAMTEQSRVLNHPLQLMAVTKNGREILSEHFITAEQQEGQWIFAAILRPLENISSVSLN